MSLNILFNFATRSRPDKFFRCLDNIYANCKSSNFKVAIKADIDDNTMNTPDVLDRINKYKNSFCYIGKSNNKIHAINRSLTGLELQGWDILINTSDDMWFKEFGFDNIIRDDMVKCFPDMDGLLHYNDGFQGTNVCTMSIMGREYFKRFNYIYHPSYQSLWCDNEATDVAKMLGKYRYMGGALFQHNHPAWGLAKWDNQYAKTEDPRVNNADREVYEMRKKNKFDL